MGVEHLHLSFVRRKEVPHAHLTPLHVLVSQKLTHKATSHSLQQHQRLAALQPLGQWLVSFREWLGHDQNVVLLLDGHSTRTVRGMPELAASLNIFMVLMYPNCTHGLQPCDKVYYSYHRRLAGVISEKVMLEQEACASLGHDAATKIPDELIISPVLACLFEIDAIIPEPKPSAMPFTPFHNRQTLEYAPPVYDDECGEMQQVEAMPTPRPRGRPPARLAHADSLSRPAYHTLGLDFLRCETQQFAHVQNNDEFDVAQIQLYLKHEHGIKPPKLSRRTRELHLQKLGDTIYSQILVEKLKRYPAFEAMTIPKCKRTPLGTITNSAAPAPKQAKEGEESTSNVTISMEGAASTMDSPF
eukprot:m.310993 g.310993  ORF g.310993 m.310993 type:complete len:358 (-) comp15952_c0_seq8:875-1948(-)